CAGYLLYGRGCPRLYRHQRGTASTLAHLLIFTCDQLPIAEDWDGDRNEPARPTYNRFWKRPFPATGRRARKSHLENSRYTFRDCGVGRGNELERL
ncbi:hypothetical protein KXX06_005369, partial [Aspergillus fumigatus]